jgi:peroxiredoxin Q/BCP
MRLQIGNTAPKFSILDINENKISPDLFLNQKTMLSFYRYASCPFCNLRIQDLIKNYKLYHQKGLEIYAIFQSPNASIQEYVGTQQAPFSIIGNPEKDLYKKYGIESSAIGFLKSGLQVDKLVKTFNAGFFSKVPKVENGVTTISADFLINEKGIIELAYYGNDISDHIPLKFVEEFIDR